MAAGPYSDSGAGNVQLYTGRALLYGFNIAENAGTAAATEVILYDGTDNTGDVLLHVQVGADESGGDWFDGGVLFNTGLFLERLSGTNRFIAYVG